MAKCELKTHTSPPFKIFNFTLNLLKGEVVCDKDDITFAFNGRQVDCFSPTTFPASLGLGRKGSCLINDLRSVLSPKLFLKLVM